MGGIKVGVKNSSTAKDKDKFLLYTPPEGKMVGQILVDIDHIIEVTTCHLLYDGDKEFVWAKCDEDDPSVELGITPKFSVVVPMVVKFEDGTKGQRFVRGPKQFWKILKDLNNKAPDGLLGLVVELTRTNGDFAVYSATTKGIYSTLPKDQDVVIQEFIDSVFVGNSDEVMNKIKEKAGDNLKTKSSSYGGSNNNQKAATLKKSKPLTANPKVVEEDF